MSAAETTATERQVHLRTCPLCEAMCGLEIHVRGSLESLLTTEAQSGGIRRWDDSWVAAGHSGIVEPRDRSALPASDREHGQRDAREPPHALRASHKGPNSRSVRARGVIGLEAIGQSRSGGPPQRRAHRYDGGQGGCWSSPCGD